MNGDLSNFALRNIRISFSFRFYFLSTACARIDDQNQNEIVDNLIVSESVGLVLVFANEQIVQSEHETTTIVWWIINKIFFVREARDCAHFVFFLHLLEQEAL